MQIPIELIFLDLFDKGQTTRGTLAYADLATGFLHSGCAYKAQIEMDADSAWALQQMVAAGLQPAFWVAERHPNQLKLPDLMLAVERFIHWLDRPVNEPQHPGEMVRYEAELRLRLEQMRTALENCET